jgi:hypothetical protein
MTSKRSQVLGWIDDGSIAPENGELLLTALHDEHLKQLGGETR